MLHRRLELFSITFNFSMTLSVHSKSLETALELVYEAEFSFGLRTLIRPHWELAQDSISDRYYVREVGRSH